MAIFPHQSTKKWHFWVLITCTNMKNYADRDEYYPWQQNCTNDCIVWLPPHISEDSKKRYSNCWQDAVTYKKILLQKICRTKIFNFISVIFLQEVRNDVNVPFTSLNRKTKKTFPSKPQFSDGLGTCMSNDKKS